MGNLGAVSNYIERKICLCISSYYKHLYIYGWGIRAKYKVILENPLNYSRFMN
tara:strand:+ start:119 stop:277 length:159 start_codon:yes stop_codon:yes gene_type:complete